MGLFDSLTNIAGEFLGSDAHQALDGALQNSSLGGVGGLLGQLQQGGLGDVVQSLAQGGSISPDMIQSALGDEHVQSIAQSLGVTPDQALSVLSQHLPNLAQAQQGG